MTRRRPMQKTIEDIIALVKLSDVFNQAIATKSEFHLRLQNCSWLPLVIEVTGEGFISVAHYLYDEYSGDTLRDPEIVFNPEGWFAVEITQDPVGRYQRIPAGRYSPGTEELARIWARNIREQGFLEEGVKFSSNTHEEQLYSLVGIAV